MSRYCEVKTEFKSAEALVEALMETGNWTRAQIEVNENAQHLYGYKGDVRQETANIIIRRNHVGGASNDIGFLKAEDGSYQAHISEYDKNSRGYNEAWMARLKGNYAYYIVRKQQEARGRRVTRQRLPNGRQRVVVAGYR